MAREYLPSSNARMHTEPKLISLRDDRLQDLKSSQTLFRRSDREGTDGCNK